MPPVFLIAGAPATGKSTASRALAAKYPKSIAICVDDLRGTLHLLIRDQVGCQALSQQLVGDRLRFGPNAGRFGLAFCLLHQRIRLAFCHHPVLFRPYLRLFLSLIHI